jgi:NAD(P)-dependent dehydrogenase (short-subunit alcohol dehydrogenase family)
MERVALVSGGNRGIGFAACRMLAQAGLQVILGSRDLEDGKRAVKEIESEGTHIVTSQLDVTSAESISNLEKFVLDTFGRLDVLVNNAGVHLDSGKSAMNVDLEIVKNTFEVNLYGPLRLCQIFLPLMKKQDYGRVVNVSSDMGSLSRMGGRSLAYRMSKAALNAMTRVIASEVRGQNIKVNTMSPGWVRSDMGGPSAPRSLEEGADTIVWLATLPDDGPTGGFFKDREPSPW